jgi:hypothetical protein
MQASRIFQMRLGKSYLLAHTNWVRPGPESCPQCDEELETVEHAFLTCPARQHARDRFLPNLNLAKAWLSPNPLKITGNFITAPVLGTLLLHPHPHFFHPLLHKLLPPPNCVVSFLLRTVCFFFGFCRLSGSWLEVWQLLGFFGGGNVSGSYF